MLSIVKDINEYNFYLISGFNGEPVRRHGRGEVNMAMIWDEFLENIDNDGIYII